MKPFLVIVRNQVEKEIDRVDVEATMHRQASDKVRESRQWPRGCTFTPRLVDEGTFDPDAVCSDFALFGALPAVRC
jgi:hypothetical protein